MTIRNKTKVSFNGGWPVTTGPERWVAVVALCVNPLREFMTTLDGGWNRLTDHNDTFALLLPLVGGPVSGAKEMQMVIMIRRQLFHVSTTSIFPPGSSWAWNASAALFIVDVFFPYHANGFEWNNQVTLCLLFVLFLLLFIRFCKKKKYKKQSLCFPKCLPGPSSK